MVIGTEYVLRYDVDDIDTGTQFVEEEEEIKVHLRSGEILIGEYRESDNTYLYISRECGAEEICIAFEEITNIEKI